jgi:hypothetical protein
MKKIAYTAVATALALTLAACEKQGSTGEAPAAEAAAGDVLGGTWKADLASVKFEGRPDEHILQGGTYKCNSCIPPLTVAADGQFHPVADRPYYDSMSVKAADERTIEIHRRKGDKEVSSTTLQVSEDGNTLNIKFTDATTPNAPAVEGTTTAKRAGPAPAGAHASSGQWLPDRLQDYSDDALNVTFRMEGDKVTSEFQGQSYTAEIGGPAVAITGDTGGTTVAVAREGANGLRETYTRGGKEVGVTIILPGADGKTLSVTNTDPRNGTKTSWTAAKAS